MDEKDKIELYLKGYEEGQKEAWSDIKSLVSKHEGWDLKSRIESRIGTLYQELDSKREELKEHPERLSVKEEVPPKKVENFDIPWTVGESYLFLEKKPKTSIRELVEIVKKEVSVLFILRDPPHKRLEGYEGEISFENCKFVMLSRQSGMTKPIDDIEIDRISPDDLSGLSSMIGKFLKSRENPVIFLSGIPFLINYNDEEKILHLLHFTKDKVADCEGCLLSSISPEVVEKTFLEKFKSEFNEVY